MINPRITLIVLALSLAMSAPYTVAQKNAPIPSTARHTRNVVLIVADGLRWQDIFTGADPALLNSENGGIWDKPEDLRRGFWRDDVAQRRAALFPFLWGTVATRGQIFGNQTKIVSRTSPTAWLFPIPDTTKC